jgi:acyl carrier protein
MDETTAKIKQFIVDEFMPDVSVDELDSDFDLLTGGVVDSLGLLQVVAWLETEFDVGVDDSQLGPESFRTVDAIKQFVDQAREPAGAESDACRARPLRRSRLWSPRAIRSPPRCGGTSGTGWRAASCWRARRSRSSAP